MTGTSKKKQLTLLIVASLLLCAGVLLFTHKPSAEEQALNALEDLVRAVETRDHALLESRLHPAYAGWGGSKHHILAYYTILSPQYNRLNVLTRNHMNQVTEGETRVITQYDWTWTERGQPREPWRQATATLQLDDDGSWKLIDLMADVPLREPNP